MVICHHISVASTVVVLHRLVYLIENICTGLKHFLPLMHIELQKKI